MQALIEWIRSSPSGFRDPTEWPNLSVNGGGSTLSIDAAIPLVQVADGTATLKVPHSALGDRAWSFVGTKEALWVDEAPPYLQVPADLEASVTQGPFLTRKIDLYGGGKIYGGATFTFDKEVLAGRFVNGDWWVNPDPDGTGSPAVLTETLPASYQDTDPPANGTKSNRIRNGLVKEIVAAENAYDTEMGDMLLYKPEYNIDPAMNGSTPVALVPGTFLMKAVSKLGDPRNEGWNTGCSHAAPIKRYHVLTIVNATPPARRLPTQLHAMGRVQLLPREPDRLVAPAVAHGTRAKRERPGQAFQPRTRSGGTAVSASR